MTQRFKNKARSTLAGTINAAATTILVPSGQGERFPTANMGVGETGDWFKITLENNLGETEIVKVRTRASGSDILADVQRAQDGTAPLPWTAGSGSSATIVALRLTAADVETAFAVTPDVASVQDVTNLIIPITNIGPIWHDDYASVLTWRTMGTFTGYASQNLGQVAYFDRGTPPPGWMESSGQVISTAYAALIAFRSSDVLLDMRGESIMGWDNGRGVDNGRAFRSWQAGQNKSHAHLLYMNHGGAHSHTVRAGQSWTGGGSAKLANSNHSSDNAHEPDGAFASADSNHTHTGWIGADGGTDTRVRGHALLGCIKF